MTKHLYSQKTVEAQDPQIKEDLIVTRILWFALGFISAFFLMYLTLP